MPLYDLIFEIEIILCETFKGLDPLLIDSYRAIDVFTMIHDLNIYNARKGENENVNRGMTETGSKKRMIKIMD